MIKRFNLLILSVPIFTIWFCTSSPGGKNQLQNISAEITSDSAKSIAVLELFTSQGCSSCPPADRLLGSYTTKENIIPISFHVDYWDHLGWKDPYSSKQFTKRQYNYASALKADVYTPQLVINGQTEMVGSDAGKIDLTIKKVLSEQPEATLTIQKVSIDNGKANISFKASGNADNSNLNIALVEKQTTTTINAGENGGATLTDYNVARSFMTSSSAVNGDNTVNIDIPFGVDAAKLLLILFLQKKDNNKIIAAAETALH
jgi:hypothetical protein